MVHAAAAFLYFVKNRAAGFPTRFAVETVILADNASKCGGRGAPRWAEASALNSLTRRVPRTRPMPRRQASKRRIVLKHPGGARQNMAHGWNRSDSAPCLQALQRLTQVLKASSLVVRQLVPGADLWSHDSHWAVYRSTQYRIWHWRCLPAFVCARSTST